MRTSRRHDEQALQRAIDGRPSNDAADDAARLFVDALRATVGDEPPTPSAALEAVLEHGVHDRERPEARRRADAAGSAEASNASSKANQGHRSAALH